MDVLLALGLLNLFVLAYVLHKVRKIHLASYRIENSSEKAELEVSRLFGQVKAYLDLEKLIDPRKPLPALRGWAASPDFLLHVALHMLSRKPLEIVECSSGVSTLVLARCCELNGIGHVYSLEHDAEYAAKTNARLQEQGLGRWATVLDAPLKPYADLGGAAMVFDRETPCSGEPDRLACDRWSSMEYRATRALPGASSAGG